MPETKRQQQKETTKQRFKDNTAIKSQAHITILNLKTSRVEKLEAFRDKQVRELALLI